MGILPYRESIFQRVKEIPFPDVQRAFHGAEPSKNKILCPFHQEKSPSFHIYDNGFKCFGCGEYGSSIDFVMKLYNLRPLEAAKAIAERFGLPVRTGPLSLQDRLRIAQAKAVREREKKLQEAFKAWVKDATWKARGLAEAIRGVLNEKGVDIDPELLPLVHELPRLEWWADTLSIGADEEKITLFRDAELRGWFA
jgi:hypothetical protein